MPYTYNVKGLKRDVKWLKINPMWDFKWLKISLIGEVSVAKD